MKNNRNTLLLIAGIAQIIKSVVCAIGLVLVSIFMEVIDTYLKINMYKSQFYAYSSQLGEKVITFVIFGILIYLSLCMFMSFASGIVCINQSNVGNNPLTSKRAIIVLNIINIMILNVIAFSVVGLIALVVDKQKSDKVEDEKSNSQINEKINELKKLKDDKVISQKEFVEMLTKLLVE